MLSSHSFYGVAISKKLAEPLYLSVKAAFQWSAKTVSWNTSLWYRFKFSADFQILTDFHSFLDYLKDCLYVFSLGEKGHADLDQGVKMHR